MARPSAAAAQQRLVLMALVVGMALYIVATAVVLQANDGRGLAADPIPALGTAAAVLGITTATAAIVLRTLLRARAAGDGDGDGERARFTADLVAIALLEAGSLFGTTTWLLTGAAMPGLATALLLLAIAIALLPIRPRG